MRTLTKLVVLVAIAASLVVTVPAQAGSGSCYNYHRLDRKFFNKTNRARVNHEKRRLKLDPQLSRVARKHNRAMIAAGSLFHQSGAQLAGRITRWNSLGENIGKGQSVRGLQRAFMRSALHRANILGSFRYVGVSAKRKNGTLWVTVIFEAANDPGTTLTMPSC